MALTPELVALCHREMPVVPHPRFRRASDAEYEALVDRLLAEAEDGLWVFAYGSLIWKPAFAPVASVRAVAPGWHRAFSLRMYTFRGSPDRPGLMMALRRGGSCTGVAMRVADAERRDTLAALVRREFPYSESLVMTRWIDLRTADGALRALTFWAGRFPHSEPADLSPEAAAEVIAKACGPGGSCAEYLYQTVAQLAEHGIHDRNLWRLQELVARTISTRAAPA